MKRLLLIATILISISPIFSQKLERNVVVAFWESNIKAIVDFDTAKIITQTNFPLEGSWGYAIGLETEPEEWTKEDYINNLESIFTEELRTLLREKTFNDLTHHSNEAGEIQLIINLMSYYTDIETQETYESSTILFFKKFDNEWKLFSIEYAG
jgi:hypothetical protein